MHTALYLWKVHGGEEGGLGLRAAWGRVEALRGLRHRKKQMDGRVWVLPVRRELFSLY